MLRALRDRAPQADVVYFGDFKNAPYGNKSREELGVFTVLGIQKLIDEGATEIVSACNSVSVSIVLPMFEILALPHANIIEMVGPTVSSFKGKKDVRVLVVATHATIESKVYQDGFRMVGVEADGLALPELVRKIEAGADHSSMYRYLEVMLEPYVGGGYTHLLMGCTHFPLAREAFEDALRTLGMNVRLVDPAYAVVDAVCARYATEGQGTTRYVLSRDSAFFRSRADMPSLGTRRTFQVV